MSLWKVAWRSIRQRALVSALTIMSMGLGVALVVAVLVVYGVVSQSFHRGGEGYDLIVGAKGGKEQLVLNTVFYLSQPIGNIPYSLLRGVDRGQIRRRRGDGHPRLHGPHLPGLSRGGHRARNVHRPEVSRRSSPTNSPRARTSRPRTPSTPCWARSPRHEDRLADRRDVSGRPRHRRRRTHVTKRVQRRRHPGPDRHAGRSRHLRQHARLLRNPPSRARGGRTQEHGRT